MVSKSVRNWIIVFVLIFLFIIIGLAYWYFEFYQAYTSQINDAALPSNRGVPPPATYPVKTPTYTGE